MLTLNTIEDSILRTLNAQLNEKSQAEVQFTEPEALTQEFKAVLLEVLARRKKENLRSRRILTVSHPQMDASEQVPFLAERSEVPTISLRRSTKQDRGHMYSLRNTFPELLNAHNTIGSADQY